MYIFKLYYHKRYFFTTYFLNIYNFFLIKFYSFSIIIFPYFENTSDIVLFNASAIFCIFSNDGFFLVPFSKWHIYPIETPDKSESFANVIPFSFLILFIDLFTAEFYGGKNTRRT